MFFCIKKGPSKPFVRTYMTGGLSGILGTPLGRVIHDCQESVLHHAQAVRNNPIGQHL